MVGSVLAAPGVAVLLLATPTGGVAFGAGPAALRRGGGVGRILSDPGPVGVGEFAQRRRGRRSSSSSGCWYARWRRSRGRAAGALAPPANAEVSRFRDEPDVARSWATLGTPRTGLGRWTRWGRRPGRGRRRNRAARGPGVGAVARRGCRPATRGANPREPWFGPLFAWELRCLARRPSFVRLRCLAGAALLVALFLAYVSWFPNADPLRLAVDAGVVSLADSARLGVAGAHGRADVDRTRLSGHPIGRRWGDRGRAQGRHLGPAPGEPAQRSGACARQAGRAGGVRRISWSRSVCQSPPL